jgi:hypothetical protein
MFLYFEISPKGVVWWALSNDLLKADACDAIGWRFGFSVTKIVLNILPNK